MKARLLKKLRKRYSAGYCIVKTLNGYQLQNLDLSTSEFYTSLNDAKENFILKVRTDILRYVYEHKHKRSIKFYPW